MVKLAYVERKVCRYSVFNYCAYYEKKFDIREKERGKLHKMGVKATNIDSC